MRTAEKKVPVTPETRRKVKVNVPRLNIRREPTTAAEIVKTARYGDDLTVIGASVDGWTQIRGGYVMTQYVTPSGLT